MELDKIFNVNKTTFYEFDENGKIQMRGRFISEFNTDEYPNIIGCYLTGFKGKNLNELVSLFPNLVEFSIEKTSQLVSLDGLQKLSGLKRLTIEQLPKLTDVSAIETCVNLQYFDSSKFENSLKLLSFLPKNNIQELSIGGALTDLEELTSFTNLISLGIIGYDCFQETLPTLPKLRKSLWLEGFPKLNDASFLNNLDSNVYIQWRGPKTISNIPEHINLKI